ncbi:MAG: signal peptide peptidase SppA [Bacteroidales bacterium]|nr:signal peptide peptidase SppA [Bacteroidales bacterium]
MAETKKLTFGKILLASIIGTLIVFILIGLFKLLTFIGFIGVLASDNAKSVANDSFLKINLTSAVTERTQGELESLMNDGSTVGFNDMLRSIAAATDDNKIKGIYLYMGSSYPLSWGKSEELRQALSKFCSSGKPILAYADNYSQQGYFLASVADSVYLNPSGMVEFRGIGAEALFYKEMLDKLAAKMTLIRPKSNSFKSAGETYTMDHFSDANRKQVKEYIMSIWDYALEQIAEARDIEIDLLGRFADNLDAVLPEDAVRQRLIDRLCFENDIKTTIRDVYEGKNIISLDEYSKTVKNNSSAKDVIAVIYAEGEVVSGSGYNNSVYSDKITKALDNAAKDDNIKAIVLRVNSPGGQVTASEIMTNAVIRAKQRKPVIVSMGDVAASAGYEISCNANYIIAEPTTLTGSIGVFAAIPEVGGTLKRYLGITTDTVNTNANSTALSILRPLSPRALELMQQNVEDFYTVFVNRVATGRKLNPEYVDSIARGRVWTGRDAMRLGLVDALGGLDDAISIAADSAGLSKYKVVDYPENDDMITQLLNRNKKSSGTISEANTAKEPASPMFGNTVSDGVWVGGNEIINTLNRILDTRGLQARVEFLILTE